MQQEAVQSYNPLIQEKGCGSTTFSTPQLCKELLDEMQLLNQPLSKRVQIQGHRGGFKPENTMASFKQAVEHGLDAIELDVWLTKDGHLIVIHGGDNGELNHHFELPQIEYIFDKTLEEMLILDAGHTHQVPTLTSVIDLIASQNQTKRGSLIMNIEVKAPHNRDIKVNYDYIRSIQKVYEAIRSFQAENHCMVSSFDSDILAELERLNLINNTDIKSMYLYNFYEHLELPEPDIYANKGHGVNISSTKMTREVIQHCHKNGKLVGVWINSEAFFEDDKFYENAILLGVDFICTDYPLQAAKIRTQIEQKQYYQQSEKACQSSFSILQENQNKLNLMCSTEISDSMSSKNTNFSDSDQKSSYNVSDNFSSDLSKDSKISNDAQNLNYQISDLLSKINFNDPNMINQ
eukprot:403368694